MLQLDQLHYLRGSAYFEVIDTGERVLAAAEMAKDGDWIDPDTQRIVHRPYEDDPLIVSIGGFITDTGDVVFGNTNQVIEHVLWSNPLGEWFKCAVSDLRPIVGEPSEAY